MTDAIVLFGGIVISFWCGAIPFGWLIAHFRGIDLRAVGSGNIGATNAARALGRGWGALVLALDAGKAALPVALAAHVWPPGSPEVAAVGLAAFFGHLYSPFLQGKGGKGVACGLGVFLALCPVAAATALAIWAVVYLALRISSVASLCGAAAMTLLLWLLDASPWQQLLNLTLVAFIFWRHRDNLRRLRRHLEK